MSRQSGMGWAITVSLAIIFGLLALALIKTGAQAVFTEAFCRGMGFMDDAGAGRLALGAIFFVIGLALAFIGAALCVRTPWLYRLVGGELNWPRMTLSASGDLLQKCRWRRCPTRFLRLYDAQCSEPKRSRTPI
jgi:hypothetical protein